MADDNIQQQPQETLWQRQAREAQEAYNNFRDKYGTQPDNEELSRILEGRRFALQTAIPDKKHRNLALTQTVLGAGGAIFGDMDPYTRDLLEQQYIANKKQQQTAPQFTQRTDGKLPEGTQARTLYNGTPVTDDDIKALRALAMQPASAERDNAIAQALNEYYGIQLPQEGTLEQRLYNALNQPAEYTPAQDDTEEQKAEGIKQANRKKAQQDDSLAMLMHEAGITTDSNGNILLPQQMNSEDFQRKIDEDYRNQDELRTQKQIAELQRQKSRQSLAALGRIIGEMIQASGGAKVLPSDLTAAYDKLDEQQRKLYDGYWARREAEHLKQKDDARRKAEKEDERKYADRVRGDERKWQENMLADRRKYEKEVRDENYKHEKDLASIRYANRGTTTKKEDEKYTYDFGNGENVTLDEQQAGQVLSYMLGEGIIPIEQVTDSSGKVDMRIYDMAKKIVNAYMQKALKNDKHKGDIYKIITGQKKYFGDAVPNSPLQPEDETPSYDLVTGYAGQPSQRSNAHKQTNNTGTSSGSWY